MEESKWASRKFVVVVVQFIVLMALPLLYKYLGISEDVLILVLGASSGLSGAYLGANVWQKKVLGEGVGDGD